jgi:hypothetical protein
MVALSLVICTKRAKIIFARQFVEMTRIQLEEYMVQFSRNIDSFKEITQFESESVRYIFIPIEEFFLILITSNNSNVIEDSNILKLVYRLLQDICGVITTESILENAYEIMLGLDDIVTLGYRNEVNIGQIKQYRKMESAEEIEFKRKKREQEEKVKKDLYEKSKEFDRQRKEKKFNTGAVSSSSFTFYDSTPEIKISSNKRVSSSDYNNNNNGNDDFKDINEEKKEKPLKDNNDGKREIEGKKKEKGLKLSKKKLFN